MTGDADPKRSQSEVRSGSGVLALLAVPLNGTILRQLFDGPKRLHEMRSASDSAPQTTVRAHLKAFERRGLMSKHGRDGSPEIVEWGLTSAGRDLFPIIVALERWLRAAPKGAMAFGSNAGKMAINALNGGWSSTILRSLAGGPHSLSQLARGISVVSYPTLERRLGAMRVAGQVQAAPAEDEGTPYGATEWLRQGISPLAAAVLWERTHFPDETPAVTRLDTEAAFLLTLPQLRMPVALSGACRMGVETIGDGGRLCGAIAQVTEGVVISSSVDLEGVTDAWAAGSRAAWAKAMTDGDQNRLELGGDRALGSGLVSGLQTTLFGIA